MNLDAAGLAFIFQFEGFVPFLYDDGPYCKGNATVAIGILVHTGPYHWDRGVCAECDKWPRQYDPESAWVTEEQGQTLLWDKANATGRYAGGQDYVGGVQAHFPNVNQNQFDAMVSFAYNLGTGYLRNVAAVYYGGGDVCAELLKYVLPEWARAGLTRRRKAECELFNTPVAPAEEEEEMKPTFAWVPGWGVFLIGAGFAHYIPAQSTVDELARLYNLNAAPTVGLSVDAARALGGK